MKVVVLNKQDVDEEVPQLLWAEGLRTSHAQQVYDKSYPLPFVALLDVVVDCRKI